MINIGTARPYWQVFTCRYKAPENWRRPASPRGPRARNGLCTTTYGVTLFEGTDFAAEAIKVAKPPMIGGGLDGWDGECPIPLVGRNQLRVLAKDYAWTPQNLNGVGLPAAGTSRTCTWRSTCSTTCTIRRATARR